MIDASELICEFENRLSEFQDGYEWDEVDGILRAFIVVGELLNTAFDPVTAARGMGALRLVLATRASDVIDWTTLTNEGFEAWKEGWDDLDGFNDSSYSDLMEGAHNIHAFAFYGILPQWNLEETDRTSLPFVDVPAYVKDVVGRLETFAHLLPGPLSLSGIEEIARTCLAAVGRLKIDLNEPLSVHELAAVTRVTPKRLQNAMYAKSADAPIANKSDGLIPVAAAQRWLDAREYRPSIWKECIAAQAWEGDASFEAPPELEDADEDFVFVPEARDGSLFAPVSCRRGGEKGVSRYTIGAKGAERDFEDFDEALAQLSRMRTPRWRRPNDKGNFGIVSAERWRRLNRAELQAL